MRIKKTGGLFIFLFFTAQTLMAQLGSTETQVISKFGDKYYKMGRSNLKEPYVIYQVKDSSATSGHYTKFIGFYFKKYSDGMEYCNEQVIMEPISELNNWVEDYKNKYEEIGYRKYRDKTNKVLFKISQVDSLVKINIWYE